MSKSRHIDPIRNRLEQTTRRGLRQVCPGGGMKRKSRPLSIALKLFHQFLVSEPDGDFCRCILPAIARDRPQRFLGLITRSVTNDKVALVNLDDRIHPGFADQTPQIIKVISQRFRRVNHRGRAIRKRFDDGPLEGIEFSDRDKHNFVRRFF